MMRQSLKYYYRHICVKYYRHKYACLKNFLLGLDFHHSNTFSTWFFNCIDSELIDLKLTRQNKGSKGLICHDFFPYCLNRLNLFIDPLTFISIYLR